MIILWHKFFLFLWMCHNLPSGIFALREKKKERKKLPEYSLQSRKKVSEVYHFVN